MSTPDFPDAAEIARRETLTPEARRALDGLRGGVEDPGTALLGPNPGRARVRFFFVFVLKFFL